jgi:hypothetical protein
MTPEGWSEHEQDIGARHLLLCRDVVWNSADVEAPYNLIGLLTSLAPRGDFPFRLESPIYAFVQFFGHPGKYEVWIEMIHLNQDESGEVIDENDSLEFGPFELNINAQFFVHGRAFCLRKVPFDSPGLYEFRVRVAGVYDSLASERLFVEGNHEA